MAQARKHHKPASFMPTLNMELPDSLHRAACELAGREGVPIEQLAAVALAEKVAALHTLDYLRERAARGQIEDFDHVLAMVPDVEPEPGDQLP
jgi:hypothetical protein